MGCLKAPVELFRFDGSIDRRVDFETSTSSELEWQQALIKQDLAGYMNRDRVPDKKPKHLHVCRKIPICLMSHASLFYARSRSSPTSIAVLPTIRPHSSAASLL